MALHDVTEVFDDGHNRISKLEVPGGWVYTWKSQPPRGRLRIGSTFVPDAAHEPDRPQVSAGIFETVLNTEHGRITRMPVRMGTRDQGWLYCHVFHGAGKPKNAISIFFTPDPGAP